MTYFAVRNAAGLVTCLPGCGSNGRVHAALWTDRRDAEQHAKQMREIQRRKLGLVVDYDVVEIEIP